MAPVLVVVYSFSGVSRQLARAMCWQFGWPMGEVVELRPKESPRSMLRCLVDTLMRSTPPIGYRGPSPAGFRTVILVSPLWAFRLASPMRTFVAEQARDLRQVVLITTSIDAQPAVDPVDELSLLTGRPPLFSVAFRTDEVEGGRLSARLTKLGSVIAGA